MLSQDAQHIKEDRQLTAALIDRLIERVEVSQGETDYGTFPFSK